VSKHKKGLIKDISEKKHKPNYVKIHLKWTYTMLIY